MSAVIVLQAEARFPDGGQEGAFLDKWTITPCFVHNQPTYPAMLIGSGNIPAQDGSLRFPLSAKLASIQPHHHVRHFTSIVLAEL